MVVEYKIQEDIDIDYISKVIAEDTICTVSGILDDLYQIDIEKLDKETYHKMLTEVLHKVAFILSKNPNITSNK